MTFCKGALATLVVSYLARGSNEPDLSITRTKDLEQSIRQCEIFQMDLGEIDTELAGLRTRFEEIFGNIGNSERNWHLFSGSKNFRKHIYRHSRVYVAALQTPSNQVLCPI